MTIGYLPPSGPWSGCYLYRSGGPKYWMTLHLNFSQSGQIDGDGEDDIASFLIRGVFNSTTLEMSWTKAYVIAIHSVEYQGIYDQNSIAGVWTVASATGEFQIWPGASEKGDSDKTGRVHREDCIPDSL
jgi:hypothetical protein